METTYSVLLVEDLPTDAALAEREISKVLGKCLFKRVETRTAFLQSLDEFKPHIIISDYKMPVFDGLTALKLTLEKAPHTPFIILTGSMNEDTAVECMKAGASDYVIKEHIKRLGEAALHALEQQKIREERLKAQAALRESEERFRRLAENAEDLIYRYEFFPKRGFSYVSPAATRLTGYTPEEHYADPDLVFKLVHPEDRKSLQQLFEGKTDYSAAITLRWVRKNRKILWIEQKNVPIHNDEGTLVAIEGIARDITERKQIEEALTKEQSLLRALMDTIPDHVYFKDKNSRIIRISKAHAERFGLSDPAHAIFKTDFDFFTQDHARQAFEDEQKIMKTGQPLVNLEEKETWPDGRTSWVSTTKVPLRDTQGRIIGTFGISRDITKRKLAEEELQKSETKYRDMVEQINDVIYSTDIHGNFTYVSPTMEILGGYKPEEMIGHSFFEYVDPEYIPNLKEQLQKVISGKMEPFEYRVKIKSGEHRWVRSSSRPIFEGNTPVGLRGVLTEITARKKAEEALDLFNHSIKSINECVTITDLNNILLFVNQAFLNTYGYTEEEVLGKPIDIVRTETPAGKDNVLDGTLHGGWHGELLNRKKDGTIFPISLTTSIVNDEKGRPIALVGVATDITERKRAEEVLRESEARLKESQNLGRIGSWEFDIEKQTIVWSEETFLLYERDLKLGPPSPDEEAQYYSPKQTKILRDYATQSIATGKEFSFDLRVNLPSGKTAWFFVDILPHKNNQGKVVKLAGIVQDITDRKRAEEALRLESAALNAAANAIVITGLDGTIQWVNRAFTTLTGYRVEEAVGKKPRDLVKSGQQDQPFYKELWDTILSGSVWRGKIINRHKDGRLYTEEQTITPLRDASGKISNFIGIKQDITQRIKLEEQLLQTQKLESLGTLASGIAHDFNNILAIMMGHTSLIEMIHNDPVRMKASIETMTIALERGASLVRQMLTFARKGDVEFLPVCVNDSIKEIEKLFRETFPKTMTLECHPTKNLPLINADPTQLHLVLINLCVNARDAMDGKGTLTISTGLVPGESLRTRFVDVRFTQYVSIEVKDTGAGIDEATRQRIFEPFFTTKQSGKGTGLGLSVAFGIIEKHEGFIDVQSDKGQGTTFFLYFPIKPLLPVNKNPEKDVPKTVPGGTETILVVEDEEFLMELLRINLSEKGYTVLTATNGEEAVEMYKLHQHEIGLVLSDLGLPKLTGHEVLKQMMAINPAVKFILASGYLDPVEKSEILKHGAKEIVPKPYITNNVLKKIRSVLDA